VTDKKLVQSTIEEKLMTQPGDMVSYDPIRIKRGALDRIPVMLGISVAQTVMDSVEVSVAEDEIAEALVFQLSALLPGIHAVEYYEVPKSPWDFFKMRYLPFLKVNKERLEVIHKYYVFPNAELEPGSPAA